MTSISMHCPSWLLKLSLWEYWDYALFKSNDTVCRKPNKMKTYEP